MERGTFDQQMRLLLATWPDRAPSKDTHAAYWLALGHLDDEVFRRAVIQCLRSCTFFPAPAEILKHAQAILEAAGMLPKSPMEAWQEVMKNLRANAPWSNPSIERAVREIGGLRHIGLSDERKELPFLRKEFLATYGEYRTRMLADNPVMMARELPAYSGQEPAALPDAPTPEPVDLSPLRELARELGDGGDA